MINLIPPVAKKRLAIEYWVRTVSMWAFLIGTALLVITTLFIPINIFVTNQELYLSNILKINEAEQTSMQQNSSLLVRANTQAELLLSQKHAYSLHELLPVLSEFAGEGIALSDVSLNQVKNPLLTIGGVAQTRESLVAFSDMLEGYEDFMVVDLPISYLIKDSDVEFVINVTLATSTKGI